MEQNSDAPVGLVTRAFDLIEALAQSGSSMALTDLSVATSIPKATTHRLLQTLKSRGYVSQDINTGRYAAGIRCFELGSLWAQSLDIRSVAAPHLAALNQTTQETVHLAVYEHGDVVYVDALMTPKQVMAKSYVGRRCPATCVATGRVLLAYSERSEIERVLSEPLPAYTDQSITDPKALADLLARVRVDGFGINRCSYRDEVSGIAAPVRDYTGRVVAAVGLCLPDYRFAADHVEYFRDVTIKTAADISLALGDQQHMLTDNAETRSLVSTIPHSQPLTVPTNSSGLVAPSSTDR